MLQFHCADWASGPIVEARGFRGRLIGIKVVPADTGVLLRTRSVHTIGLRSTLGIVALSADRQVLAAASVPPRRVVIVRGAVEFLELPPGRRLPPEGARLESSLAVARPIVSE